MAKFSPKRRVLAALLGGKVDRVPATCIGACGGSVSVEIQEAVGIYWPEAFRDPEKMANLAIASQKITGLENVNIGHEFSILPEALGCEIKWYDRHDLKPAMISHSFEKPEDLKMPTDLLDRGRIPAIMEAIHLLRKEVGDLLPITSFVFGPYSLAGELAEPKRFIMWSIRKPEDAKKFVDFATEVVIEYAKAQYRAGSDVVSLGEPLGTPDKAGPQAFRELIKPALEKIAKSLDGIRVMHLCGDVEPFIPEMVDIGFDAISVKQSVDIARIKPILGDIKILGNIESRGALTQGTPNEVRTIARKALEAGVDLLEPGCGIEPLMPINNIKVLAEEVRNFKLNR
ncbi:MAG: MtaA/CmuA family methyltransferase [Candidatus Methylarchaceae archaeon HK02M1]|nr:MtaA/CmuA family methyltransferase [Candidatus Methylarchaceae archaeon HK02M1]